MYLGAPFCLFCDEIVGLMTPPRLFIGSWSESLWKFNSLIFAPVGFNSIYLQLHSTFPQKRFSVPYRTWSTFPQKTRSSSANFDSCHFCCSICCFVFVIWSLQKQKFEDWIFLQWQNNQIENTSKFKRRCRKSAHNWIWEEEGIFCIFEGMQTNKTN